MAKLSIVTTKRFRKNFKKVAQSKTFDRNVFEFVIDRLVSGEKLESNFRVHRLTGDLSDYRECHLKPDILLIYFIDKGDLILVLVNIGSHSELFK